MEYTDIYFQQPTTSTITALNTEVQSGVIETESGYDVLIGIAFEFGINANADLVNATEFTRALTLDNNILLPQGFDVKRLVAGAQVPLDKRFFPICKPIKCAGSQIQYFLQTTDGVIGTGFDLKFYPILGKSKPQ